jgi:hypothetical protein
MAEMPIGRPGNDDPRRLRELLGRAARLASSHDVGSVVVGVAGRDGDVLFPEVVDFIESALRVDDAIFRMTRERAVLMLVDVDRSEAEEIVGRLLGGFRERFAVACDPDLSLAYFEVRPGTAELTVKQVLPALFAPPAPTTH